MREPSSRRMSGPVAYLPLDEAAATSEAAPPPLSFLLAINAFAFAYSMVVATLGIIVLPSEATYMFLDRRAALSVWHIARSCTHHAPPPPARPDGALSSTADVLRRHAVMLGVMLACTGVTQLISPAVGYASDRSTSQYGRRRPTMAFGALLACAGSLAMKACRQQQLGYSYIMSLMACVLGVNISYACYTALLPDFIPPNHMGRASGVMAMMSMLGSFVGFVVFGFWLQVVDAYFLYCAMIVVTISITCWAAKEEASEATRPFRLAELLQAYTIDVAEHSDFFWVFVTRTFYYMGISVQAFGLFMLRDVQRVDDPKYYTALLAMIGQLAAAIVAIPAGRLSDRTGRKPMVYMSCLFMGIVYSGFACSPSISVVLSLGVLYGIGNGMFLSVDYALACDVLPSLEHAAQSLGVWGVSAFLGSTMGPLVAGPLLTRFGSIPNSDSFSAEGYAIVSWLGVLYVACAAYLLRFIRGAR